MAPPHDITHRSLMIVIAALLVVGFAAAAAHGMYQQRATAPAAPKRFTMHGSVTGLYPGGVRRMVVVARNPYRHAIRVGTLKARVVRSKPGCPASNLFVVASHRRTLVRPRRTALITMRVRMRTAAPDACQRATFVLKLTARATK